MKQEANLFTVNDLEDVYDFVNQYIEQDCRIISVAYDGNKTALIVYEYDETTCDSEDPEEDDNYESETDET